ncbi:DNA cytosine methyltransferase [Gottfriedia acidiceleris]|uniref:DNA cytosine methyltransferase n=1 Tax=Gottfriedia acidiceleris TaxID=371036 RepID=UPI0033924303
MKAQTAVKIDTMSNNVFDRNVLSKREMFEMVDNFIQTVQVLSSEDNSPNEIDLNSIFTLIDIGLIDSESELEWLENLLPDNVFDRLILSVNRVNCQDLMKYDDLSKYSQSFRGMKQKEENGSGKPTLVDLFCGSGGLSLGLTQSGFRVVLANDIEKSALRTYSFNHPEIDASKITIGGIENIAHNVRSYITEEVDVIAGGPPCQGFSTANRQRIIDDPRNVLYKYYVETVKQLQPKFFIMENVKGMKVVADQVVEDFNNNVPVGYDISFDVLNARKLGVPQNRERLIYIGVRQDIVETNNIGAIDIINSIHANEQTELGLKVAIDSLATVEASRIKNSTEHGDEVSGYKIFKRTSSSENSYVSEINQGRETLITYNHKARYNNDRDIEIFGRMIPGDKSDSPRIADIMPYTSRSHMFKDKYFKLIPDVPCKTITAHMKFDCNMYIHPTQARGLTPREAARVQSYPDDYFFLGPYTKTYQQIGNSVPPLMAKIIGNEIIKFL